MKKGVAIVLCTILFSIVLLAKDKSFTGRVIYVAKDHIEVKYGKTEKSFYINEKSVFLKNKNTVTVSDIEICQIVRITYTVAEGKMFVQTCTIVKDSDCK